MNTITKKNLYRYSQGSGVLSIAGLLFLLPFSELNTIKEILFVTGILAFLTIKLFDHGKVSALSSSNRPLTIFIALSFVWGFIALSNAIDPGYSLNELIFKMSRQYILYFLSFYIVSRITADIGKVRMFFLPLALSTLIMSLYACFQFYQIPVLVENRVAGFTGAFYRLAVFLVLSIPAITVLVFTQRGWLRWILLLILPFSFAALIFTFVRAAWIAVVIEISILVFIIFKKQRKSFILGLIILSLIFTVVSYTSKYKNLVVHGTERPRLEAFELSLDIISKYPLTGIGYGKKSFSKYYPNVDEVTHSHNIFVNTAVEVGIPGLVIFISMLVIVAKDFIKAIGRETVIDRKLILSGIFTSIAGFLTLNLFDYMYHGWPGQMFWMLIGIGYALIRSSSET